MEVNVHGVQDIYIATNSSNGKNWITITVCAKGQPNVEFTLFGQDNETPLLHLGEPE